jgi:hypothetical protein
MSDLLDTPVPAYIPASILLAARRMLDESHAECAVALLTRAEHLIPRVVDPIDFLNLTVQVDKLWRHSLIQTGLRPKGIKSIAPCGGGQC